MGDGSSTMGWLERTFLYTFGLSGLILLLHSGNIWIQVVHLKCPKSAAKVKHVWIPGSSAGVDLSSPALVWTAGETNHQTASCPVDWIIGFGGDSYE